MPSPTPTATSSPIPRYRPQFTSWSGFLAMVFRAAAGSSCKKSRTFTAHSRKHLQAGWGDTLRIGPAAVKKGGRPDRCVQWQIIGVQGQPPATIDRVLSGPIHAIARPPRAGLV